MATSTDTATPASATAEPATDSLSAVFSQPDINTAMQQKAAVTADLLELYNTMGDPQLGMDAAQRRQLNQDVMAIQQAYMQKSQVLEERKKGLKKKKTWFEILAVAISGAGIGLAGFLGLRELEKRNPHWEGVAAAVGLGVGIAVAPFVGDKTAEKITGKGHSQLDSDRLALETSVTKDLSTLYDQYLQKVRSRTLEVMAANMRSLEQSPGQFAGRADMAAAPASAVQISTIGLPGADMESVKAEPALSQRTVSTPS